jgi:hypothetical protein
MLLNPLDLIGIDGNFLPAPVERDHLGHWGLSRLPLS